MTITMAHLYLHHLHQHLVTLSHHHPRRLHHHLIDFKRTFKCSTTTAVSAPFITTANQTNGYSKPTNDTF